MGVLGHLISNFETERQENLATEALYYILTESEVAQEALVAFINQSGSTLKPNLHLKTQTASDAGGVPDLVGEKAGEVVFLLESKFWAELTDHQPEDYLKGLSKAEPGVCVFVAPSRRIDHLWIELQRLCKDDPDLEVGPKEADLGEFRAIRIGKAHRLVLCSWPKLLNAIRDRLDANGETMLVQDVDQLDDLCRSVDTEGFRPLLREELASRHGQRIIQFRNILSDLRKRLEDDAGLINQRSRKGKFRSEWYYRINVAGFQGRLLVSYVAWSELRHTPFWMALKGGHAAETSELKKRLDTAALTLNSPREWRAEQNWQLGGAKPRFLTFISCGAGV